MAVSGTARHGATAVLLLALPMLGCTTIDPGPDFVVPDQTFNADYFYCHVEPEFIFAKACGPGMAGDGNGCHFNASAVSGMPLFAHSPVNCNGGDHPVDATQTGTGSPAESNFEAVSLEMSHDYLTAPLFVRPSGTSHPRAIFSSSDPAVNQLLRTWASK